MLQGNEMTLADLDVEMHDRREEYYALINMLGYAQGIAQTLGAKVAADHADAARQILVAALQEEFPSPLTKDGVMRLAATSAGHC
ncbi:hypothetical protein [Rhizobium sp. SSA_523]|uniref:hypothetical protein n=1 Tax=Rhizobium sp. SSA_523 TaxID=2952477 RepID=UPI002090688B|nr:hypothetical protein [Rhizobium sp. SSA_523]MCO5732374.1 hypothetical protein [Rhizobium sp. SSA_523]WKC21231.1 hypothetical protein QTJ18_04895 [Rhizobium sp. SSA_523]